jgi:hypothetical protein
MRPLLRDAMHASAAVARKIKKEEEIEKAARKAKPDPASAAESRPGRPGRAGKGKRSEGSDSDGDVQAKSAKTLKASQDKDTPKEFATLSTSAPRRLNDIAEAPPELKQLPRGAKAHKASAGGEKSSQSLRDGVLSMAQKAMLEEERERVIKAYREMKKRGA